MNERTFVILGGYGNTGRLIAHYLLQEADVQLILAGRDLSQANAVAEELNQKLKKECVRGAFADASDSNSLRAIFLGSDCVIVASSTVEYTENVARAALEIGIDYLDIQYSTQKIKTLKAMSEEIEAAGRCFITDGGFHPGLPAALIRYAAQFYDRIENALVGSVIQVDWSNLTLSESTAFEFIDEMRDFEMLVYKQGRWNRVRFLGMFDTIKMDFGGAFGKRYCIPMFLEEMRHIPLELPSLRNSGFYIGGFNWFVDWVVFPLVYLGLWLFPNRSKGAMTALMSWGLKRFSRPPYGTLLKVESDGLEGGEHKEIDVITYHEDGYVFTAVPVVACLLQYLDGTAKKPGLWTQAIIVEPTRFMNDMERMGIDVKVQKRSLGSNEDQDR